MADVRRDQNIDGVRNPEKTFVVFTGIVVSFTAFILPMCAPYLYFHFTQQQVQEQVSLITSLWGLLGVLTNSLWIGFRLKSTMREGTGYYSKWTLEEQRPGESGRYLDDEDVETIPHKHTGWFSHASRSGEDAVPKRHSFRDGDEHYASIASLEQQIRKEIM